MKREKHHRNIFGDDISCENCGTFLDQEGDIITLEWKNPASWKFCRFCYSTV